MERDKYYVPQIEEFHKGFIYEELFKGTWIKTPFDFENLNIIESQIKEGVVRVKYFEEEDILPLGWRKINNNHGDYQIDSDPYYATWTLERYTSRYPEVDNTICIKFFHPEDGNGEIHFFGKVKNRSEFEKVMRQLNIK